MKNSKQIADYVFSVRDEHVKRQKIKAIKLKKAGFVCSLACMMCLVAVGINQLYPAFNELPEISPIETTYVTQLPGEENSTEANENSSDTSQDLQEPSENNNISVNITTTAAEAYVSDVTTTKPTGLHKPVITSKPGATIKPTVTNIFPDSGEVSVTLESIGPVRPTITTAPVKPAPTPVTTSTWSQWWDFLSTATVTFNPTYSPVKPTTTTKPSDPEHGDADYSKNTSVTSKPSTTRPNYTYTDKNEPASTNVTTAPGHNDDESMLVTTIITRIEYITSLVNPIPPSEVIQPSEELTEPTEPMDPPVFDIYPSGENFREITFNGINYSYSDVYYSGTDNIGNWLCETMAYSTADGGNTALAVQIYSVKNLNSAYLAVRFPNSNLYYIYKPG